MKDVAPKSISTSERIGASWRNATREEALHEIDKLYWRQFHTFLWNFPVVAVKNYLLFNFGKLLESAGMREAKPSKNPSVQETLAHSHMMPFWKRNLLSNAWALAATPIVKAHFMVVGREIIKSDNQLAGEALSEFEPHLQDILKHGINQSAELKSGLEALWQPAHSKDAAPDLQTRLQELQTKRAQWEKLFNPAYVHEFSQRPAKNTGEALMAIAYVQVLMRQSNEALRSLEFIDPDGVVLEANQILTLTDFARKQAALAGLDGNTPTTDAHIIRYANTLIEKLCTMIPAEKLELAVEGKHHQHYRDQAENLLQSMIKPEKKILAPAKLSISTDTALSKPWSVRTMPASANESAIVAAWKQARRAEAKHESGLLLRRTLFKRIAFLIPSYTENLLLGHKNSIENVAGTLWEFISYPFAYGPGIVFTKEFSKFRERQAIVQSQHVQEFLQAASTTSWQKGQDDLLDEARNVAGNPFLEAAAATDIYRDLSVIVSRQEPDTTERSALQHFQKDYGNAMLQQAKRQLNGEGARDMTTRLRHIIAGPVNNIADARLALSALQSIQQIATQQVDMLLFVPKSKQMLDRKQLQTLSNYVQAQMEDAGFVPNVSTNESPAILMKRAQGGQLIPLDESDIIRLANVSFTKLRSLTGTQKLSQALTEKGSEDLQEQISQSLYAGAGKAAYMKPSETEETSHAALFSKQTTTHKIPKRREQNSWQSLASSSNEPQLPAR